MELLAAAVVVVGLLSMVNLLLMVGVIRRLRKMATQSEFGSPMMDGLLVGERVPEFAAMTTTGEPVTHELVSGPAFIAFFSPGCPPCEELLPRFIARARTSSSQAFAVVVADPGEDVAEKVERLREVARVVVEAPTGDLQRAFKVQGYPTVYVIDADGTVAGTDLDARVLVES